MKNSHRQFGPILLIPCLVVVGCLCGCVDYNNRPPPTQAQVKQADQRRQAYVDTIPNLTPEQRSRMKEQMGGPKVQTQSGPEGSAGNGPATGRK